MIESFSPIREFISVDLPTLGIPIIAANPALVFISLSLFYPVCKILKVFLKDKHPVYSSAHRSLSDYIVEIVINQERFLSLFLNSLCDSKT